MAAVFNVYVSDEQRDKIERIADNLRVNRSQVFRWIIDAIDESVFVPSISIDGNNILSKAKTEQTQPTPAKKVA